MGRKKWFTWTVEIVAMRKLKLTESFLEPYKTAPVNWGYNGLGGVVYKRTYAAKKDDGTLEDWWETCRRVVEGTYSHQIVHCEKNGLPFDMLKAQHSAQKMYALMFDMKWLPPGRGLQHMGRDVVDAKGAGVLYNCSFLSTESIGKKGQVAEPFCTMMDLSMLGIGVGFDTKGENTASIVQPKQSAPVFIVEDTREGWVEAVRATINPFFGIGSMPLAYDYSLIRAEGALLNTMGGISSGYKPLELAVETIKQYLGARIGTKLDAVGIVDLMNIVARCVVSGGVRRSALLALGDPSDDGFMSMKDPSLHGDLLNEWRWASNNSISDEKPIDYKRIGELIAKNGEPGVAWLDNAKHYGRIKDGHGNYDLEVQGCNPCAEIFMVDAELCNLNEVPLNRLDSLDELRLSLKYAYLYSKTVTLVPTHNKRINAVIGRNRRIGTSITGITQAIAKFGYSNLMAALDDGYKYLRELDILYSRWLCIPTSIKITTCKPSGSVSILSSSSPGVHFPHAEYYIRRFKVDRTSPILNALIDAGYEYEESIAKDNSLVFKFPVWEKDFTKGKADASMREQLELAAQLQYYWADNSVSVTVTFNKDEEKDIPLALEQYSSRLKSVSMLPLDGGTYKQAPYETCTKDEYERLASKLKPIDFSSINLHEVDDKFCEGDKCSIG